MTAVDIRRAGSRFHTKLGWLDSHHSFSFGRHYDAANTGHGLLIVSNDDVVAPGGGFTPHPHRDMEIVTWVLEGELEHRDSEGNDGLIHPGLAQRMSAGSGITHSEMNHSRTEPVHFIQMWVLPDEADVEPGYEQRDVNDALATGDLVAVASGRQHDTAISIRQRGAVMWAARLPAGRSAALPDAPFVHVFTARGDVTLGEHHLSAGDAARLVDTEGLAIVATAPSEIVVWESDPGRS